MKINLDDTIAAISTPAGEGGIGIVRMSGKKALSVADRIFVSKDGLKPSKFKTYTVHYGRIVDKSSVVSSVCAKASADKRQSPEKDTTYDIRHTIYETIDEVILTVMHAPKSYTKEDIVEINCHGGIVPLKRVLELVIRLGARLAEPGEFTRRAFLNGRIDLAQAEAVLDVIHSKTEVSLKAALHQLEGGLSSEIGEIKNDIMDFYAHIEASIDFPEEDIEGFDAIRLSERMDAASKGLKGLLETAQHGKILREGVSAVICGKPNVGKSTLMNAFLKEDRVIVTPVPGTTRDVIEEVISIDGIALRIADTAGIIEPSTLIDKESVNKSRKCLENADLALLLMDNSKEMSEEDRVVIEMVKGKKAIVVINKIDLPKKLDTGELKDHLNGRAMVEVSAAKRTNLELLEKAIAGMVWSGQVHSGHHSLLTNVRHADAVRRAHKELNEARDSLKKRLSPEFIAAGVKNALDSLGEVTGEIVMDDLLDRIFGEFCIGK